MPPWCSARDSNSETRLLRPVRLPVTPAARIGDPARSRTWIQRFGFSDAVHCTTGPEAHAGIKPARGRLEGDRSVSGRAAHKMERSGGLDLPGPGLVPQPPDPLVEPMGPACACCPGLPGLKAQAPSW